MVPRILFSARPCFIAGTHAVGGSPACSPTTVRPRMRCLAGRSEHVCASHAQPSRSHPATREGAGQRPMSAHLQAVGHHAAARFAHREGSGRCRRSRSCVSSTGAHIGIIVARAMLAASLDEAHAPMRQAEGI